MTQSLYFSTRNKVTGMEINVKTGDIPAHHRDGHLSLENLAHL
jgi:hypothetical protein